MSPQLVIDLISSSPSPPPLSANVANVSGLAPKRDSAPAVDGARPRSTADGLCLADLSDDDGDDFSLVPRKRRRRDSPAPDLPPSTVPPLLARPAHSRVVESIDVSSSMEQPSPAVRTLAANLPSPVAPKGKGRAVPVTDSLCSDPFASSSPAPRPRQSARRAISLDPLVGSSSPIATSAVPLSPSALRTRPGQASLSREPAAGQAKSGIICIDSDSSDGSDNDLPDVDKIDFTTRPSRHLSSLRRVQSDTVRPALPSSRLAATRPVKRTTTSAADKAAEKERKKREREQAKDARTKEKARAAALAEANKLRTDKKVSTREMIVDLPSALPSECRTQLEVILRELGVEHTTWDSPELCLVKWRRKVTSWFDDNLGRWEPISPRVHEEHNVLVIFTAAEFVDLVLKGELDAHIKRVKLPFARHQVIYVLQGMTAWLRKNRNLRNRQFASGVRSNQGPARGSKRAVEASASYISEDTIEDALLRLQVEHDVYIHHTAVPVETVRWVAAFTQHISTVPYRRQRDHATSAAGFCMESGQVKTGEGAADTYVRMLQEIMRVTAPVAYGVATEFDSVSRLVVGLDEGGPERLGAIKRSANMDGLMSDRAIGQAISRRLYKIFTGRDEMSTDV
ncbi:hypothetical protein XA68_17436 [Ophiocordyceps unilateralis]|uniref:ERCC4 domain-containing protein n=1 Tax=Ophiocordyceps unilateralis TaxID=268505 RepID=A0A2A9P4K0_OPHUN|nr:hypothetical protein XA68_17436 [Ophiocordyceps unilateralis]